jgi:predicted TPR repeat methyltransferase
MTHDPLACGDLIAERRFAYARAAAHDGDFHAAAEVLEQALGRAPDWAAAWFALGEARARLGHVDAAAEAFRAAVRSDPVDTQGATARLALIRRGDAPNALPQAYVARLFDQYAPRFEAHLSETLGHRAPALIAEALGAVAPGRRFAHALDLGCGTGLMGEALTGSVDHLPGVDLSPLDREGARARPL